MLGASARCSLINLSTDIAALWLLGVHTRCKGCCRIPVGSGGKLYRDCGACLSSSDDWVPNMSVTTERRL